jgi:hypothetical protein
MECFGGKDKFEYIKCLDEKKRELCKENNLNLIYLDYKANDVNNLIKTIQNETTIHGH